MWGEFLLRSHEEAGTPVWHLARFYGLHPAPVGRAIELARPEGAASKERPVKAYEAQKPGTSLNGPNPAVSPSSW